MNIILFTKGNQSSCQDLDQNILQGNDIFVEVQLILHFKTFQRKNF